jgi:hypothetical protein
MNPSRKSRRTRVLTWFFSAVLAVSLALVIALIVSLSGYFVFGWESAPVPQIVPLMFYVFIPLVLLRLALGVVNSTGSARPDLISTFHPLRTLTADSM